MGNSTWRSKRVCTVDGCDRAHNANGLCTVHQRRLNKHGSLELPPKPSVHERFWSKVDKSGACWLWTGSLGGWGYGTFNMGDHKYCPAHRYAYIERFGDIPTKTHVDHRCRNRRCVNPDHLRAVTCQQNTQNHGGANKNSRSGIRGVHWSPSKNHWVVQVSHDGKVVFSKSFASIEDAELAAVDARNRIHTHNDRDREQAA